MNGLRSAFLVFVQSLLCVGCAGDNDSSGSTPQQPGPSAAGQSASPMVACTAMQKMCPGSPSSCVSVTDPNMGCGDPECTPCSIPNADATCDAQGQCAMGSCSAGFANCDADPTNGCETPVTNDDLNCGGCGIVCPSGPFTNATGSHCASDTCVLDCQPDFFDIDQDLNTGCESIANPTCPPALPGIGGDCNTIDKVCKYRQADGCMQARCAAVLDLDHPLRWQISDITCPVGVPVTVDAGL